MATGEAIYQHTLVRVIPAKKIRPPHAVRCRTTYSTLHRKMGFFGWTGRPLLVSEHDGERYSYYAWTGSHRLAAASEREMDVPCVVTPWSRKKCIAKAKALGVYFDGFPIGNMYAGTVTAMRRFEAEDAAWWLPIALMREERRHNTLAQLKREIA